MLLDIYQGISNKIKAITKINSEQLTDILSYIWSKPIDSYIYPEVVQERFNIELEDCMKLLVILEKKDIIKMVYKVYCPTCKDFSEQIFESINDLEDYVMCEECSEDLFDVNNPYKYVTVYFKVIRNESRYTI